MLYREPYGRLRASHGSHMKAAHNVLYKKKHTQMNASYPAMDISCMPSRALGVNLEVEGVHYIEMHRRPASHVLGPPPSQGGNFELEGGVNVGLCENMA